jgi:glucose/arabinose dehydrogenase
MKKSAVGPTFESLESRRLLSQTIAVATTPLLTASAPSGTLAVASNPSVTATTPANNASGVHRDIAIVASVALIDPSQPIDTATLTTDNVKLNKTLTGGFVNTTFGVDANGAIVITPTAILPANTQFTFKVTTGLKDTAGVSFAAFQMTFTTGTAVTNFDPAIKFNQTDLPITHGVRYTTLAWGPDNKLYAGTINGRILRFPVNADGTLGSPEIFTTVNKRNGVTRCIAGIEFDPASTPDYPVLWVTHGDGDIRNAADWSGKLSLVKGPSLEKYIDYVIGLPHSIRDHMTNQMDFGPDGALYVSQGAMNAMGGADPQWQRPDHLLSAAILRVDVHHMTAMVDVKTAEGGGTYDPYASGAPVTLYATGVRNAWDIAWHSNGHLYAPTNGSAAGGTTPAGPNNDPPQMDNVPYNEPDWLFDIQQGGYYGHADAVRGEYVMNGGNPTAGVDHNEVPQYPVGTQPDSNYRGGYNLQPNYSPTGTIEYESNTFGGRLKGKLLMQRWAGGDDIDIITFNSDGSVAGETLGVGMEGFTGPIDLVEDPRNGNLYSADYGDSQKVGVPDTTDTPGLRITLLTPAYPSLTALRLIDADHGISLGALKARQTINLGDLPTHNLSIRALGNVEVGSVRFGLDGNDNFMTENYAPFALNGNNPDGSYIPWTPAVGRHTLTITPFSGFGATGTQGDTVALTFQVVDIASPFGVDVNFQPQTVPTSYKGTKSDVGRTYGLRGNGLTYGWTKDNSNNMFDRNSPLSPDNRFDTGALIGSNRWDFAVKDGRYSVWILAGDPTDVSGNYGINVEGVSVVSGTPTTTNRWLGGGAVVTVTDNTLTITAAAGSSGNKINLVQIRPA